MFRRTQNISHMPSYLITVLLSKIIVKIAELEKRSYALGPEYVLSVTRV